MQFLADVPLFIYDICSPIKVADLTLHMHKCEDLQYDGVTQKGLFLSVLCMVNHQLVREIDICIFENLLVHSRDEVITSRIALDMKLWIFFLLGFIISILFVSIIQNVTI